MLFNEINKVKIKNKIKKRRRKKSAMVTLEKELHIST
jgi:hypothetical protein